MSSEIKHASSSRCLLKLNPHVPTLLFVLYCDLINCRVPDKISRYRELAGRGNLESKDRRTGCERENVWLLEHGL